MTVPAKETQGEALNTSRRASGGELRAQLHGCSLTLLPWAQEPTTWDLPQGRAGSPQNQDRKGGGAHPPALLTLQQLAVGSNFHVQGQLDVHERLVVTQQPSQVLLGVIQGSIQVPKFLLSIF